MPDRRARRAAIAIVGGFVVMDLSMIAIGRFGLHSINDMDAFNALLVAVVFAQSALSTVWTVTTRGSPAVRSAAAALVVTLSSGVFVAAVVDASFQEYELLIFLLAVFVAAVAFALLAARIGGAALVYKGQLISTRRFQFRILHGLALMAAVAVALALSLRIGRLEGVVLTSASIAAVCMATSSVGCVWAAFGAANLPKRLLLCVAIALGSGFAFVTGAVDEIIRDAELYRHIAWLFGFLTFLVAIPLFIFRRLGYRFTRRRLGDVQEEAPAV